MKAYLPWYPLPPPRAPPPPLLLANAHFPDLTLLLHQVLSLHLSAPPPVTASHCHPSPQVTVRISPQLCTSAETGSWGVCGPIHPTKPSVQPVFKSTSVCMWDWWASILHSEVRRLGPSEFLGLGDPMEPSAKSC